LPWTFKINKIRKGVFRMKKVKKVERGDFITRWQLLEDGWKEKGSLHRSVPYLKVFEKKGERIIWNSHLNFVVQVETKKGG